MNLASPITVEWALSSRKKAKRGPIATSIADKERIPRLARLMALAIKFEMLIREGVVRDYADLARLGHVSRARMTHIMNLLHLAPDIQEQLLDLHLTIPGHASVCERDVRKIARVIHWSDQRLQLQKMCASQALASADDRLLL